MPRGRGKGGPGIGYKNIAQRSSGVNHDHISKDTMLIQNSNDQRDGSNRVRIA